jgi:DNA-binding LacI/PurR family transcriptional regulator
VDGVVFNPWAIGPEELDRLGTTPLVLLGEREAAGRIDHVAIDNVAAARDATEHLLSLGRRRIAAIGEQPHLENNTARLRVEGYEAALRGAGLEPDPALRMAVRALHRWDGAVAMVDLLDADKGLDAVFCFTDQLALGAMRVLAERGLHVPEDVAVVGFDDIEDGRYHVPSLTTVSPDKAQIAELALDCLARRIAEPETDRPGELLVADHVLRSRESTGVRNERIDQQTKQKRTGSHS